MTEDRGWKTDDRRHNQKFKIQNKKEGELL